MSRPAVFLDRDGVLVELVLDPVDHRPEGPLRAGDVRLAAGAVAGIRALADAGVLLVVASNQPAAAKGKTTTSELTRIHERTVALLAAERLAIEDWRYCLHHPHATEPALRATCACRKPRPGMLLDAAADHDIDLARSWMVGDADTDVAAGRAAGAGTVLIAHPSSTHRRGGEAAADVEVRNLAEAAAFLLPQRQLRSPSNARSHLHEGLR
jgi:D-glycero-D-manno-heptose 1,7-bisphosphate phosphatase